MILNCVCNNKRLSHGWQCDMIFIKRVVVRYHERARNERGTSEERARNERGTSEERARNERGTSEERARNERGTSEERASEWYHTNTSLIKLYHTVTHVIYLFIIYHNTRNNRNFVNTYHSHISIYYTSTHCHFLTLQITVCLNCHTQQAMHNVLCDVLWRKNKIKL